jgi:hypothetical protein
MHPCGNLAESVGVFRIFIISLITAVSIGMQNYTLTKAAANLTYELRSLSFRAVLRQDSMLLIVLLARSELMLRLQSNSSTKQRIAHVMLGVVAIK